MKRHCPRCDSDRVRGSKHTAGEVTTRDFYCEACQFGEECSSAAADYVTWWQRWEPDDPDLRNNEYGVPPPRRRAT